MKKNVLIVILLLILTYNIHIYIRNIYVDYTVHNYKCSMNLNNEDLGINYNYVFNVSTDGQDHITKDEYYEEFIYTIDNYYQQSKEFYSNTEDEFNRTYDDDKKIIRATRNYKLSKNYDSFETFKEAIANQNFKCEEVK